MALSAFRICDPRSSLTIELKARELVDFGAMVIVGSPTP